MNAPFNVSPELFAKCTPSMQAALEARAKWQSTARPNQLTPWRKEGWAIWLMLAGRGFGKTRAGAEDVAWYANCNPGHRVAIIAPTYSDARDTCVEGESGLLSILPKACVNTWNRSMGELHLENGSRFKLFGAEEPDRLRGPQHHRCFIAGTKVLLADGSEKCISKVIIGDFVQTRKGPRRVIAAGLSDNPAQRFIIEYGETSLTGTADHPILVGGEWKPLGELKKGDEAWQLSLMTGGAGIQHQQDIILEREKVRTGKVQKGLMAVCIVICGENLRVQFQKVMTSIMWTKIQEIMSWKTLNFSFMESIQESPIKATRLIQTKLSQLRDSLEKFGKRLNGSLASVLGAGQNSNQEVLVSQGAFAATCAPVEIDSTLSFQSKDPVLFASKLTQQSEVFKSTAQKNVHLKPVTIESVRQLNSKEPVYNLTVEGEHEYIANGIVVHNCWCDELGAWRYADTWDQMLFGLRLGRDPQVIVTTTPKPTKLIKELARNPKTLTTRGSTFDNAENLAPAALAQLKEKYEGTRLGRQELMAEILEQSEGALWTLEMIERARWPRNKDIPDMRRIVVAIDPAISAKAESNLTGITAAGLGIDNRGYFLADSSGQYSPDGWARKAVALYDSLGADCIVAEGNQGGDMVRHTIQSVRKNINIHIVHASRGKQARAEPVAALYEQDKISHVGIFPEVEAQLCSWEPLSNPPMPSPDRLDALVWGFTELMIKPDGRPVFGSY